MEITPLMEGVFAVIVVAGFIWCTYFAVTYDD